MHREVKCPLQGYAAGEKLGLDTESDTESLALGLHLSPLCYKELSQGRLGGSVVEHLPSAQGMIPGSWDRVLHRAPRGEPASPSACVSASLCVSHG